MKKLMIVSILFISSMVLAVNQSIALEYLRECILECGRYYQDNTYPCDMIKVHQLNTVRMDIQMRAETTRKEVMQYMKDNKDKCPIANNIYKKRMGI